MGVNLDLEAGVSLGQLLLALGVLMITGGIAWGGLMQRVKTLEKEVTSLSGFAERLTRIEERTNRAVDILDRLDRSWLLAEPPSYVAVNPTPRPTRRRQ